MNEEKLLEELKKANDKIEGYQKMLGDKMDKKAYDEVVKTLQKLEVDFGKMQEEKVGDSVKVVKETVDTLVKQVTEMLEFTQQIKERQNQVINPLKSYGACAIEALEKSGILKNFRYAKGNHVVQEFKVHASQILKAAANMGTGNVTPTTGGAIPFELAQFEAGLTRIARRRAWIMAIANVVPITTMYAMWAEQANPDGSEGSTAQGAAKNQIDFDWVEKSKKVEKYTAYIKVSKEALSDLAGLQAEIDQELRERLELKVDSHLLDGDGVTPNIAGIRTGDTAFAAAASFAGLISSATKWDVLRVAVAQVIEGQFYPNYILMHPNDVAAMEMTKDNFGQYVLPPFKAANGMTVSGVQVLENTDMDADNFTVGDFSKLNVRLREDSAIDIGLDADDFTKNLVTILGEIRLASYIKTNHAGAFVSGDFTSALALITAP